MLKVSRFAALIAAAFILTGAVAAQPVRLRIVASFSILADVVQNITLGAADVSSLIPRGADPHGFEPSARDIAALEQADIVILAGAGFEETLLQTITTSASGALIIEASACVPVRAYGEVDAHAAEEAIPVTQSASVGPLGLDLAALCAGYDVYIAELDALKSGMGFPSAAAADPATLGPLFQAGCLGHAQDAEADDEVHGTCDPHVWSNPRSVYYWTLYIRDVLSAADPANADLYAANEEEYLYAIDDLLRLELDPLITAIPAEDRTLLSNHETLGYFAAAYGFEMVGFVLPGGSAMAEPSAQDLAALIDLVQTTGIRAIFSESTLSSRVAEQVASESGAQIFTLYTDSLSAEDGEASTYLDYITYNFTTIAAALSR